MIISCTLSAKTIRYVKVDGTGDGSSWANAANNIQTMINNSASGDEVWVAAGTYFPTTETIARDSRSRTFLLSTDVKMYGGFAGIESDISQRVLADLDSNGKIDSCELVNKTILSGDIDGIADNWVKTTNADQITWSWTITGNEGNCYHVLTRTKGLIDGFSVVGGNANSSGNNSGGGIYSTSASSSVIINCTISNCSATGNGGGIYSNTSASYSTVDHSTVMNCSSNGNGGGIYSTTSAAYSSVTSCSVTNCSAVGNGGGIYSTSSYSSTSTSYSYIANCTISNCSATNDGGGIFSSTIASYSYSYIANSTISNCSTTGNGGGIYSNTSYSSSDFGSLVDNCTVTNCSADKYGGGIYSTSSAISIVTNCTVSDCSADKFGGGIYATSTSKSSYIANCTVANCTAASSGGGIYASSVTSCFVTNCSAVGNGGGGGIYASYITNCTVTNCSATIVGGGIYSTTTSSYSVINCIVTNCYANALGGGLYVPYSSVTNCALSNNSTNGTIGSGLTSSTQFACISPDINLTFIRPTSFVGNATTDNQKAELLTANWHLIEGSPCINAGYYAINNSSENDLDTNSRVLYGIVDIGAYEYVVPTIPMPIDENFDALTTRNGSQFFYNSDQLNGAQNNKWTLANQKAVFNWQTNITSTYSQSFFTYLINATNSSSVYLRYDMYYEAYAGSITPLGTEKLNIEYSTDFVTWSTIATYSNADGTIANQTYTHNLSSQLAGKKFFIRFNANGANSNRIEKWEIDNVFINADGLLTAVNPKQENKYKYTINNGIINITNLGQDAIIQIFDINGKNLVNKIQSEKFNCTLPAHGVYLVKVTSNTGIENKKIVW